MAGHVSAACALIAWRPARWWSGGKQRKGLRVAGAGRVHLRGRVEPQLQTHAQRTSVSALQSIDPGLGRDRPAGVPGSMLGKLPLEHGLSGGPRGAWPLRPR